MTNVTKLPDVKAAPASPNFDLMLKALAAKLQSAINYRERAETSVIVATLALDGQLSDFDWRIAQALRSGAWTELSGAYEALQQAMAIIPESHRPQGFQLDEGVDHG